MSEHERIIIWQKTPAVLVIKLIFTQRSPS